MQIVEHLTKFIVARPSAFLVFAFFFPFALASSFAAFLIVDKFSFLPLFYLSKTGFLAFAL
jgi:hypothetical protein